MQINFYVFYVDCSCNNLNALSQYKNIRSLRLFHVRRRFQLQPETHSLAVYLLDTALFKLNTINKKNLQLYGVACVFIAAKYEEIIVPHIDDFVFVSADAYIRKEILTAEIEVGPGLFTNSRNLHNFYPTIYENLKRVFKIESIFVIENMPAS